MSTTDTPLRNLPDSDRPPAQSGTGPPRWFTVVTAGWLIAYAAVRLVLLAIEVPVALSATGPDLIILSGPAGVGVLVLALAAVTAQVGLLRHRTSLLRWLASVPGALASAALMAAGALILLDLVGGILPGLGLGFFPAGALSRVGCVAAAVLTGTHTWLFWRSTRPAGGTRPLVQESPGWVVATGYVTVAACLTRLIAQAVVGMDANPLAGGPAVVLFEAGFLLAGIVLPLALAHRWGRVLPSWVPAVGGRRLPRGILLVCGSVLGVGMVAYFGMMTVTMVLERIAGRNPFPPSAGMDLPEAFFWVSVPAYLVWGLGLTIGTLTYARITAPVAETS